MRTLLLLLLFLIGSSSFRSIASDLRITEVKPVVTNGKLQVNCKVSWNNSWRDQYNWDAVWLFFKYYEGGKWKPLYLQTSGHTTGELWYSLATTGGKAVGAFLYRKGESAGDILENGCTWTCETGSITQARLDEGDVQIAVEGVEMVYVPWGAFSLGDGVSVNTLAGTVNDLNALSATFPNGYKGFYTMKYEISQEQYVAFLNTLTLAEQQVLLGPLAGLVEGDYIFGDKDTPTNRNGIILYKRIGRDGQMVFAHNYTRRTDIPLSKDINREDDGQTIACNFLTTLDLLGYASWAGLRPMSEYEFEKACRPLSPAQPVAGEYAWNRNSGASSALGLVNEGKTNERPVSGNVNYNNGINGPLRCGSFGAGGTGQVSSGAGFWGVMELSGNVKELCYNTNALTTVNRETHGAGTFNPVQWDTLTSHWGTRGGGFDSPAEQLRIADRSDIVFTGGRRSNTGFRCVRTFEPSNIALNPGTISGPTGKVIVCLNESVNITIGNGTPATITGVENSLPITYKWYVNGTEISGKRDLSLVYTYSPVNVAGNLTLTFMRKAFCGVGEEIAQAKVNVLVVGNPFSSSLETFTNASSGNTYRVARASWFDEVPQKWTITSSVKGTVSIDERTGVLNGLSSTICGGSGITVQVCYTACPEHVYTKTVRESGTRSLTASGSYTKYLLPGGQYTLDCRGAAGGRGKSAAGVIFSQGGNGGIVSGVTRSLSALTTLTIYVGAQGGSVTPESRYGGAGGWGYVSGGAGGDGSAQNPAAAGGGGGASAILMGSTRLLVGGAGGGGSGGAAVWYKDGGYGGLSPTFSYADNTNFYSCAACVNGAGGRGLDGWRAGGGGGGGHNGSQALSGGGGLCAVNESVKPRQACGGGGGKGYRNTGWFASTSYSDGGNSGGGKIYITVR